MTKKGDITCLLVETLDDVPSDNNGTELDLFNGLSTDRVDFYMTADELIKSLRKRDKGKTFDQIAEWLNEKGYLFVRGKKFKGNHVHSIVKNKRLKDEKLEREYLEVRSDFSLEVVNKTLVNMFEGFIIEIN